MKKQIIDLVALDDINFEYIEKDGQKRYVALFEALKEKSSAEHLKGHFTRYILDKLRALFIKCEDISSRTLSRPDFVEAKTKQHQSYLRFSITEPQYQFYHANKSQLIAAKRLKFSHLFFHKYQLPNGGYIYLQRIPDIDVYSAKEIASYFRDILRENEQAFMDIFKRPGLFSALQNQNGRFVFADFIKSDEDYQKWILFLQKWSVRAKSKGYLKGLPEDFFSDENKKKMQDDVDSAFTDGKVPVQHLVNISEHLSVIYDFKWCAVNNRYELPNQEGESKRDFYLRKTRIKAKFAQYGLHMLINSIEEPFPRLYFHKKNWEYCKKLVDAICVARLQESSEKSKSSPFSLHKLTNGEEIYLHVGNSPWLAREINYSLENDAAIPFEYAGHFCVALLPKDYHSMESSSWYQKPAQVEFARNQEMLTKLIAAHDFVIPVFPDVASYLTAVSQSEDQELLSKLLSVFDHSSEKELCGHSNKVFCQKVMEIFRDIDDIQSDMEGLEKGIYDKSIRYLHHFINMHLHKITYLMSLENYYRYLRVSFKNYKILDGRVFPFQIDFDREKIVYNGEVEQDGSILVFLKNGRFYCDFKKLYPTGCSYDKKSWMRRTMVLNLMKLLLAVVRSNATIYQQQPEEVPNPLITLKKDIPPYSSSEKYEAVLTAMDGDVAHAEDVMKTAKNKDEIIQSEARFAPHVVIADGYKEDIGSDFYLMADSTPLNVEVGDIITYYGQALVVDRDTIEKKLKGIIRHDELGDFDRRSFCRGGRLLLVNRDWVQAPGAGHYINHTSDVNEQNVKLEFVYSRENLEAGVVFRATKPFTIAPFTATRIVTSYGHDEKRLATKHGIPIGNAALKAVSNIHLNQLTGIRRIDAQLEMKARQFALAKQPKKPSILSSPAAKAPIVKSIVAIEPSKRVKRPQEEVTVSPRKRPREHQSLVSEPNMKEIDLNTIIPVTPYTYLYQRRLTQLTDILHHDVSHPAPKLFIIKCPDESDIKDYEVLAVSFWVQEGSLQTRKLLVIDLSKIFSAKNHHPSKDVIFFKDWCVWQDGKSMVNGGFAKADDIIHVFSRQVFALILLGLKAIFSNSMYLDEFKTLQFQSLSSLLSFIISKNIEPQMTKMLNTLIKGLTDKKVLSPEQQAMVDELKTFFEANPLWLNHWVKKDEGAASPEAPKPSTHPSPVEDPKISPVISATVRFAQPRVKKTRAIAARATSSADSAVAEVKGAMVTTKASTSFVDKTVATEDCYKLKQFSSLHSNGAQPHESRMKEAKRKYDDNETAIPEKKVGRFDSPEDYEIIDISPASDQAFELPVVATPPTVRISLEEYLRRRKEQGLADLAATPAALAIMPVTEPSESRMKGLSFFGNKTEDERESLPDAPISSIRLSKSAVKSTGNEAVSNPHMGSVL